MGNTDLFPGREVHQLSQASAGVKKWWNDASTAVFAYMACIGATLPSPRVPTFYAFMYYISINL